MPLIHHRGDAYAALWIYVAVVGDNLLCINDLSIYLWEIFPIDNHLTRYVSGIYPPRLQFVPRLAEFRVWLSGSLSLKEEGTHGSEACPKFRGATVSTFLQLMIDLFVILFNHFPQLIKSSGCKSLDIDCPLILEIASYRPCPPRTAKPHPYGTRFFKFVSV